ncbi:MAG: MBL fold metallo-hydrolase [Spirochaetaceae bacterium]|jgi:glyoxylase-like metal-dependent hydrolase (beta-lactamase superfamily II)|nr:MBL fold metallo-hydrolase [Spirochaetaceae bacterium]
MHEKIVTGSLETNCWIVPLNDSPESKRPDETGQIVRDNAPAAVIDPGADAPEIIACLERRKLYPKYILLTHGHFDHIAALPALYKRYSVENQKPLIAIGRDDLPYLGGASLAVHQKSFCAAAGNSYYVDQLWEPMPEAGRALDDGDTLDMFTVLHLPGHTQGSVAFFDTANKRLYSGDTLFRSGVGRTDLPGGDWNALQQSLMRLFKMDGDITVYPGHGDSSSIAREASFFE